MENIKKEKNTNCFIISIFFRARAPGLLTDCFIKATIDILRYKKPKDNL